MNARIIEAQNEVHKAECNLNQIVSEVQSACAHAESDCVTTKFDEDRQPFNVCKLCGYAEHSWRTTKLRYYGLSEVNHDKAHSYRVGVIHTWEPRP